MDNQPRLQTGYDTMTSHGHQVWADACIQQILNAQILIRMAKLIGAYWALLAGIVPEDRRDAFIAHLENEREFNRPHRIPSLSADHPEYDRVSGN